MSPLLKRKIRKDTTKQLFLPFVLKEEILRDYFAKVTGKAISLTLTCNSTSMLSVKPSGNTVAVRLQRMFLEAGDEVFHEIAGFIKNRRCEMPLFHEFTRQNRDRLNNKSPRKTKMRTRGTHHDLKALYETLNDRYFNRRISCSITWGIRNARRRARNRTLGSFVSHGNVIRISPLLDSKRVPGYFVAFIVYHEMLHADMGIDESNGTRSIHSREFRKREKLYEDYDRAMAWEKKNL